MSDKGWTYKLPFQEILRRKEGGPQNLQQQLAASVSEADLPEALQGTKRAGGAINTTLHPADDMFVPGNADHYLNVGLSAFEGIRLALSQTGARSPGTILDMPCGFGRVTRVLRAAYPNAAIHACDIQNEAIDFCVQTFDCQPFVSNVDFNKINRERKFDLIWCGSLLTHLSADRSIDALRFFRDCLSSDGVCLVSTHGEYPAQLMQDARETYGLHDEDRRRTLDEYEQTGFGYSDYPEHHHYGTSLTKESWMNQTLANSGCQLVFFQPRGFDNHQDLTAFQRGSKSASG